MPKKQKPKTLLKKIRKLPLEVTVFVAVFILLGIFYMLAFGIEKQVTFTYAEPTCTRQLTLLPAFHKQVEASKYSIRVKDGVALGGVTLVAFSVCFSPKDAPTLGESKARTAPFGGWLAQKTYNIKVAPRVRAEVDKITKPVPMSRPLVIELSGPDMIFSYNLKLGDRRAPCKHLVAKLACELDKLGVVQGQTYTIELQRTFRDKPVGIAAKRQLAILSATRVVDSTIKGSETVYSKPQVINVAFDKKLASAKTALYRIEGSERVKLSAQAQITDTTVKVNLKEELARQADYELVIEKVVAEDGSSLEESTYRLPFKTSGGPKAVGANIGRASVPLGITVAVSFDQELSVKQDISKFVTLSGGAALAGKQGNQLLISLRDVPKCGDFSIKITSDLQSNYEIAGNSAWSFTGRTICYTVGTIGYSHRGRAINAYYFGNGSRTVMYTGAIHGNEYGTKSLMERWIQELEANPRRVPGDKQVVIVPVLNPDGLSAGVRTNAHNVDLNRNFATSDWRSDVTDVNNRPFPGGGGASPMSEPETVALASLAQRLRPILVLSYHSIGGVVAANLAGNSGALAVTYASLSGYSNTTGQTGETFEYGISGTADDWYAERLGIPSILVELSSHTYHQFERNQQAMWAMVGA